jgi:hypothetical protein
MNREMDSARPVTKNRALSFVGAVVIWLILIAIGNHSAFINGFLFLILAAYLARSISGISPTSAVCDTDAEIRQKLDANNLRKKPD